MRFHLRINAVSRDEGQLVQHGERYGRWREGLQGLRH
jgi:hypothetical protein